MQRLKSALAWTIVAILTRILIAPPCKNHSFEQAVLAFSFGTLDLANTCILLVLISIVVPIVLLFMLLHIIYRTHFTFRRIMNELMSSHIFYGYIALLAIYILDITRDTYFQESRDVTNEWTKYILHFALTPPLFVDSVYSVEVERIRTRSKRYNPRDLSFSTRMHCIVQAIQGTYLLYALFVILFIHNDFDFNLFYIVKHRDHVRASAIFRHIRTLVREIVWCVFTSLSIGLVDQWILFRATS